MIIQENKDVTKYSTMRLPATASYFAEVTSEAELVEAIKWAQNKNVEFRVIGGGSNIFFSCDLLEGLLIVNSIKGIEIDSTEIIANAGEDWDKVVEFTVDKGLNGIESMSLIPGSIGAAPVQNIGAYGQQLSDVFVNLRAYDIQSNKFVILGPKDVKFGYRTSIFKAAETQRYVITQVTMNLSEKHEPRELYKDLQVYLEENNLEQTPQNVRSATIAVRERKLPNPNETANNGSFFANPVVSLEQFEQIAHDHPEINEAPEGWPQAPRWIMDDSVKISAGWLIDQIGYTDKQDPATGMRTWPTQSLVLVNDSASSPKDLKKFRNSIQHRIKEKFGVELRQEPEEICLKNKN